MKVSPEERQAIKYHCAEIAVQFNNAAAAWAALAVLSPPAGLISAAYWYLANEYQALANDPPRLDFDKVDLAATADPFVMHSGDPATQVASTQLQCALSLRKVVTALERHDGAASTASVPRALNARRNRLADLQLEALKHNASQTARHQGQLVALRPSLNSQRAAILAARLPNTAAPSVDDVRTAFKRSGDGGIQVMVSLLGWSQADQASVVPQKQHPIFDPAYTVKLKPTTFGAPIVDVLTKNSASLIGLVVN